MQDPKRYETFKTCALRDANEYVPRMIADMKWRKGEKILDYGCGAGSTGANLILPQVELFDSKMYSVDVSNVMLEHAKREYPNSRTVYAEGDILTPHFPFRHIQFDKIFGIYVLHFMKDYRNALREFYRILRVGGQGGFSLITESCFSECLTFLGESGKWGKYMKGYSKLIPEWLERGENAEMVFRCCLKEIGFEIVKIFAETKEYFYENIQSLVVGVWNHPELYFSLNPFITAIPLEEHSELKTDLRKFLTKRWNVPKDAASLTIGYQTLYLVVRKPEGRIVQPGF